MANKKTTGNKKRVGKKKVTRGANRKKA